MSLSFDVRTILGRQPAVWYYNIDQEQAWNDNRAFPSVRDPDQSELVVRQEQQLLLLAREGDTLLWRHRPDPAFLDALRPYCDGQPSVRIFDERSGIPWREIARMPQARFVPYIVTESLENACREHGIPSFGAPHGLVKRLNDKLFARQFAQKHRFATTMGSICESIEELKETYAHIVRQGYRRCVIKTSFGSSGKGIRIVDSEAQFETLLRFIGMRSSSFRLLLEAWHPWRWSLNAQLAIEDERVDLLAVTEQRIDASGMYLGTRFKPQAPDALLADYRGQMLRLAGLLQAEGYRGVIGVDSIAGDNGDLYPIVEMNARFTQVTYLLPLTARLSAGGRIAQSRFYRWESQAPFSFEELDRRISTLADGQPYVIYNFAQVRRTDKTICRFFVLFHGDDAERIDRAAAALDRERGGL